MRAQHATNTHEYEHDDTTGTFLLLFITIITYTLGIWTTLSTMRRSPQTQCESKPNPILARRALLLFADANNLAIGRIGVPPAHVLLLLLTACFAHG